MTNQDYKDLAESCVRLSPWQSTLRKFCWIPWVPLVRVNCNCNLMRAMWDGRRPPNAGELEKLTEALAARCWEIVEPELERLMVQEPNQRDQIKQGIKLETFGLATQWVGQFSQSYAIDDGE